MFFKDRITEYNRCFYLNPNEIKENEETIFYGLPDKIESVAFDKYRLGFYGNGKLISLQAKNQPPGFVFESANKDEYGFTEMVLFHKKSADLPLVAIR